MGRVLDYGCADVPYRRFFAPDAEYVPADLPGNPHARIEILPDGTLPLEPDEQLRRGALDAGARARRPTRASTWRSATRVLRPGGRMLLSTHGIMVYHPDPVDYWRWTCAGLRRAVDEAGLRDRALRGHHGAGRDRAPAVPGRAGTSGCRGRCGRAFAFVHADADRAWWTASRAARAAGTTRCVRARGGEAMRGVRRFWRATALPPAGAQPGRASAAPRVRRRLPARVLRGDRLERRRAARPPAPLHPVAALAGDHGRARAVRVRAAAAQLRVAGTDRARERGGRPRRTASCRSTTWRSPRRRSARRCPTGTTASARSRATPC